MAHVGASFAVNAGTYAEGELDLSGLSPDQMAERIWELDIDVSLCHQCANGLSDPEPSELVGFNVDGVEYVERDGHWVAS